MEFEITKWNAGADKTDFYCARLLNNMTYIFHFLFQPHSLAPFVWACDIAWDSDNLHSSHILFVKPASNVMQIENALDCSFLNFQFQWKSFILCLKENFLFSLKTKAGECCQANRLFESFFKLDWFFLKNFSRASSGSYGIYSKLIWWRIQLLFSHFLWQ